MKKFVSLLTCAAFLFSSVRADEAPPLPPVDTEATIPEPPHPVDNEATIPKQPAPPSEENLATSPEIPDDTADAPTDDGKKYVGQAANDGSKAAGSGAGKYVLAACAIAVGVAALILVSTHSGHK
jgi:hypothetical protein